MFTLSSNTSAADSVDEPVVILIGSLSMGRGQRVIPQVFACTGSGDVISGIRKKGEKAIMECICMHTAEERNPQLVSR